MSVFRYYLPGIEEPNLSADVLCDAGLGDVLADCLAARDLRDRLGVVPVHANGPDDKSGLVVVPMPTDGSCPEIQWRPERQEAIDCGTYWLITDPEDPPTPTGLQRVSLIEGYTRELGDGNLWQCPVISQALAPVHLPKQFQFDGADWLPSVAPAYRSVWLRSQVWSLRLLPEYSEVSWEQLIGTFDGCDAATRALAVNYRVGARELSLLGALTTDALASILDAAIDKPFFDGVTGKKKADIQAALQKLVSSSPGAADSTETTGPAAPTSS